MILFKHIQDLQNYLSIQNVSIGFVPTMGALHKGHISLIKQSKKENQITVCSIFVNPTQFNDKTDFDKYPTTINQDIDLLTSVDTDILFLPCVDEMYPNGITSIEQYNIGYLNTILDGAHRVGHFNGVCVVVHKLLNAVKPNKLYMGEKDFQQCLIVKRLLEITNLPVELITCPTFREPNGLAMSSRNMRLTPADRETATTIFKCLCKIKEQQKIDSFKQLQEIGIRELNSKGFIVDYLLLANAKNLSLLEEFNEQMNMIVLVAATLRNVRLIDNLRM